MVLEDPNEVIMSPVVYTEVIDGDKEDSPYLSMPLFKLQDLFLDFDKIPAEVVQKNAFKVRFTTYRFDPKDDIREAVQSMCPKCKVTRSCKDLDASGKAKCTDCNTDCQLIYQV